MAVKVLFFDYKETESKFFKENRFENYDIKFFDFSLNSKTLAQIPEQERDCACVISVGEDSFLTDSVINGFKNLRIISVRSDGFDNINKHICIQRNINVLTVSSYSKTSVSEYTFGLIINLLRKISYANISVRNNEYKNKNFVGCDLKGLTLGVVGTGSTGASVCRLANAFGMKVLAYDLKEKTELKDKYNIKYVTLDDLLANSDITTLHLPFTGDNYHMFSEHEFEIIKDKSYFVNVSKGELVDNLYLRRALVDGRLRGVGLDVVACKEVCAECKDFSETLEVTSLSCFEDSMVVKELIKMPNVIITPHIAYETQNFADCVLKETFEGIMGCIRGGHENRVI